MTQPRIVFDRVWKKFHRGQMHDSLRDLIPDAVARMLGRVNDRELAEGDFWAVRDLSFDVLPGDCLGIIGPNGSGKSTSLKLLTRILAPTRGRCEIVGRAGTLIEVSAGFHGDLTGRENVFLQGAIMGMARADIVRKFDKIVEFSGIADAIDTPVKRYSSGMNARLGFSIAAHLEPDVLIIDEVLAVGDMAFQERAFGRIRELARSGIPVVIVSHQLDRIAELCSNVILLNRGVAVTRGPANEVIAAYVKAHDASRQIPHTGVVRFDSVSLSTPEVRSGDRIVVSVRGEILKSIEPEFEPLRLRVRSLVSGGVPFASGSRWMGVNWKSPGPMSAEVELQANLPPGSYVVEVVAQDLRKAGDVDAAPSVIFNVTQAVRFNGPTSLNPVMRVPV